MLTYLLIQWRHIVTMSHNTFHSSRVIDKRQRRRLANVDIQLRHLVTIRSPNSFHSGHLAILDVEQPGYFLPTMHSAPRQPSRRVKQTTALHCQRLRIAFISPLFTLSYAKLFFIVCCTNNSVNGDDLAFFRIPNEASERERRGI